MFKPKKVLRGNYTAFLTMKDEPKMKKGEHVIEEVKNGVDPITGEDLIDLIPQYNKFTFMNIVKNYEEGEEPADFKDKEAYMFFMSSRVDENDWVAKDKETKKILGFLDFDNNEFLGEIAGKKVRIPMDNVKDRILQVYEIENTEF
ncbi:MAG: hypothetical protein ACRC0G_09275 [Fusobacteriaceae bacterium]